MRIRRVLLAATVLALAGASAATAQTVTRETVTTRETVRLSPEQRTTIYKSVTQRPRGEARVPKKQIDYEVGVRVPEATELEDLPDTIVTDVPSVRRYKYMVVNNQVLLVDPVTSEVVEIIRQ